MSFEEALEYVYGTDTGCNYCSIKDGCNGGMRVDGNGSPIFPPCTDYGYEKFFNYEAFCEDVENGEIEV